MDWRRLIDPELAGLVRGGPTIGSLRLEDLPGHYEQRRRAAPVDLSDQVERRDVVIDDATGVSVRCHRPLGVSGPLPVLLTIHGGGFIVGSNRMDDIVLDEWCSRLPAFGVSVDYRLAPEHPYPAALDDCVAAVEWIGANVGMLGADVSRLGVFGVSAGGGLAAAVALREREDGRARVTCLLLESPSLDDRQRWPSNQWEVPVADRATVELGWRAYLGELYGTDDVPAAAAPGRAADLKGMPATCITVGELDGLIDEARAFSEHLRRADVPTVFRSYAGAPHLFTSHRDTAIAKRCRADQLAWLQQHLSG
ncbi:MAG: alpha/beta hydrolase fold domain-containing protein [Acidimicrobiia bacterium]